MTPLTFQRASDFASTAIESGRRTIYTVIKDYGATGVNTRTGPLWRPDRRFPGEWMVRRHETGGIELTFTGARHDSPSLVKVVPPDQVDRFILSCLDVRSWNEE
jgi:hypothetical protein